MLITPELRVIAVLLGVTLNLFLHLFYLLDILLTNFLKQVKMVKERQDDCGVVSKYLVVRVEFQKLRLLLQPGPEVGQVETHLVSHLLQRFPTREENANNSFLHAGFDFTDLRLLGFGFDF